MLVHILGILTLSALAFSAFKLLKEPYRGIRHLLTVHDLGTLEGTLPNLTRVIVIADHVEDPQDELRTAVKRNFQRGVRYLFLVSHSKAPNELRGYFRIFEALADVVTSKQRNALIDSKCLVLIQGLPYDWPAFPYIFYELETETGTRFVAVKGNQAKEGIADFYTLLEPTIAHMIAVAVLSGAPEAIATDAEKFRGSDVIPIDKGREEAKAMVN